MNNDANTETVHPGLTLLRGILTNTDSRRGWVALACSRGVGETLPWHYLLASRPNLTVGEMAEIKAFILSI